MARVELVKTTHEVRRYAPVSKAAVQKHMQSMAPGTMHDHDTGTEPSERKP